jgi:hypothetical protein
MFHGIWFVTTANEDEVIAASENYDMVEHGEWPHSIPWRSVIPGLLSTG